MSRRQQIRMTDAEVGEFLHGRRTMSVATHGPGGRIHLVAMWYGFDGAAPAFWTYARSQKVANLRRDPAVTCLVEDGETYDTLRGVELVGRGVILDDHDSIMRVGASVYERYNGPVDDPARQVIEAMGAKRVAVRVEVDTAVSWDHHKLGGTY